MDQRSLHPSALAERVREEMKKLNLTEADMAIMKPQDFRRLIKTGEWTGQTTGACHGFVQTNLAIVPKEYAFDFLLYCYRNPKVCSLIDVTAPGDPHPPLVAPQADIRTDLPGYRVFRNGKAIAEPNDIRDYWRDDLVSFGLEQDKAWSETGKGKDLAGRCDGIRSAGGSAVRAWSAVCHADVPTAEEMVESGSD